MLAAGLAAFNGSFCYVGIYTPLKRRTTLNTHIGAIPGALPALIGWAAVSGELEPGRVDAVPDCLRLADPALPVDRVDVTARTTRPAASSMLPVVDPEGAHYGAAGRAGCHDACCRSPCCRCSPASRASPISSARSPSAGSFVARVDPVRHAIATRTPRGRLMRASLVYLPLVAVRAPDRVGGLMSVVSAANRERARSFGMWVLIGADALFWASLLFIYWNSRPRSAARSGPTSFPVGRRRAPCCRLRFPAWARSWPRCSGKRPPLAFLALLASLGRARLRSGSRRPKVGPDPARRALRHDRLPDHDPAGHPCAGRACSRPGIKLGGEAPSPLPAAVT